jgi:hypothetical protein
VQPVSSTHRATAAVNVRRDLIIGEFLFEVRERCETGRKCGTTATAKAAQRLVPAKITVTALSVLGQANPCNAAPACDGWAFRGWAVPSKAGRCDKRLASLLYE